MDYNEIDTLKNKLDTYRPLPKATVKSLHDDLIVKWTYNSNAIEGNTLTVYETKVILEEGITIGGKKLQEHFEVINHKEAILFIEDIVKESGPFTEYIIKSVHNLILNNIDKKNAGAYRKENVLISGASHKPTDYIHINYEMETLIHWYNTVEFHPIEKAALLHCKFVNIHPFIDGNGRTARLLLNFELMKQGYPPIIITVDDRFKYYEALDKGAVSGDYSMFFTMVANYTKKRLEEILSLI